MKQSLVFVATTPFAVNAFLRNHLLALVAIHEVTLCVNTTAYPLVDEVARSVRVRHIDITRKINLWQDFRAFFQLLRFFWEIGPTSVHSITPKAGLLALLAALLTRVPRRFHTFTGQLWVNKTGLKKFLFKCIDWLIVLCATQVFADSASQCHFLETERIVRRDGVTVLGQGSVAGVDLARFCLNPVARFSLRNETGLANSVLVFLFVGRLVCDKGVFDLIQAFAKVNAKCEDWELWIVGPDEEGLQTTLQAEGQRIGGRIRWFGPTSMPERFMAAADVFVLPSYREGFGSVIIEAAACGIPSIAYRIDGVIDSIVDGCTGLLVDKGDIQGLSDKMILLGTESGMRKKMGDAAHLRASSEFSSTSVTTAWLDFYSSVLRSEV